MSDRRIHARTPGGVEIVRYDRAGKWYAELRTPMGDWERRLLTVGEAVELATEIDTRVYLRVPGGDTFDRLILRATPAIDTVTMTRTGLRL